MRFSYLFKLITYLLFVLFLVIISFSINMLSINSILELMKDEYFLSSLKFGILTASIATMLSCFFGIPAGYFLARSKGMKGKILDSFFDIPIVVPPLIIGVFLLNFLNSEMIAKSFQVIFTFKGAVFAQFLIAFPFTLKMSKNAFELVSPIYERIAMTLGAGYFKSFYDTTFKLAFNGILSGILLSWLRSFGEFGATLLVAGGIRGKTENIPVYIYLNMLEGDYEKAIAAGFLGIIVALIIIIFIKFKSFRQ